MMKKVIHMGVIALAMCLVIFTSCKKETEYSYFVGNPTLTVNTAFQSANFGDSLEFTVQVGDSEIALSTVKAQLFYTDDMVSETVIRTKENGQYSDKIYVPFYKNVPNGTGTIKFVLQNISKKTVEQEFDIALSRPDYPYLTLITESKSYRMNKVGPNQYAATENFPFSVKGYIKAPKFGTRGNELNFGWVNNAVDLGSTNEIPFSNSTSGIYDITFNTLTYEAAPFIIAYAINGNVFSRIDDTHFRADLNFVKGEDVAIDGIEDVTDWWIDPDFFTKDQNGQIKFNALSGKYRVTADFTQKYFVVEAMAGNELVKLNTDGTGAIWIIGEGLGKPSVANNQVGWNTDKAVCMAPIGNKKYQITLVGNKTINATTLNFKFFHQKGWGGEFGHTSITTTSDIIFIGNGNNGRDSGNVGIISGKSLQADKVYVLTIDLSEGNQKAVLTFSPQG